MKFSLAYLTPLIVLFSLYTENNGAYTAVFVLFVMIPLIELFTKGSTTNLSKLEEELEKENKIYDWMIYGLVPLQYMILIYFLFQVSNESLSLSYKIGATTAYGMACGILGINAAHELGHRPTKHEQLMSKLLLLSTLYMHFFIEHNRGHHKHVSTDLDPASSRYGETVYAFYGRTIFGSYRSAWQLEAERLKKKQLPFWSLENEMLNFQLIQLILILLIGLVFGLTTLLFFIVGAFIGILLLETVNYIEHYGLRRKQKGESYERTMPIHSWNSNHPLGRLILLELSRHSDHHYMASRKYQILRHFDESPQMPTGYPGMLLLSLVPPLWFKVMHKRIEQYKQTQLGVELG
ncbi:MAG: alkane 1-monooxygenase [Chitinophagaceae bacterium BSSC1]|jgi:alkane 1-monooxygenase|nr:MAG: alkane 1-monooxygenase [Chitinophagaceae bacterium BSSC1]